MRPVTAVFHDFVFPAKEPPAWHAKVERWYQLDAAAFGVCELFARAAASLPLPKMIFLASPGGSGETDLVFVRHGAAQPAKFVHTLPNVRGSVLLQVMDWKGPMLCIQDDPSTVERALAQAALIESPTWVIGTEGRTAYVLAVGTAGEFAIGDRAEPGVDQPVLEWLRGTHRLPVNLGSNMQLCWIPGGRS